MEHERLTSFFFFFKNGFKGGKFDTTLFIMHEKYDFLIVQIYVDDTIFGATNQNLFKNFFKLMQGEYDGRTEVLSGAANQATEG